MSITQNAYEPNFFFCRHVLQDPVSQGLTHLAQVICSMIQGRIKNYNIHLIRLETFKYSRLSERKAYTILSVLPLLKALLLLPPMQILAIIHLIVQIFIYSQTSLIDF